MRKVEYLSPTSIAKWIENRAEFYQNYLFDHRLSREPQTLPMSIGSAFDAYVKSALFKAVYGPIDPKFDFQTLFEAQVEPHNRDWALEHGQHAFDVYKQYGAFDDLLVQLSHAKANPKFETDLRGPVGTAVLLGKPDAYYYNEEGHPVILDWKVNGYCSNSAKSPEPGYVKLRGDSKKTMHPKCIPVVHKGTMINGAIKFEAVNQSWASQLAVYAWLCGNAPGDDFVVAIDQLACGPSKSGGKPEIRVAEHRAIVGAQFQKDLMRLINQIWHQIEIGHIYENLSLEESQERCREHDKSCLRVMQIQSGMTDGMFSAEEKAGHMTF